MPAEEPRPNQTIFLTVSHLPAPDYYLYLWFLCKTCGALTCYNNRNGRAWRGFSSPITFCPIVYLNCSFEFPSTNAQQDTTYSSQCCLAFFLTQPYLTSLTAEFPPERQFEPPHSFAAQCPKNETTSSTSSDNHNQLTPPNHMTQHRWRGRQS